MRIIEDSYEVVGIPSGSSLNEILQNKQIRFAFVEQVGPNVIKPLHPLVMCRDYLKDVVFMNYMVKSEILDKSVFDNVLVHGFSLKDLKNPVEEKTQLLVYVPADVEAQFLKNLNMLTEFEQKLGAEETIVIPNVTRKNNALKYYLVIADKQWQESVFSISLFSFIFRYLCYNLADGEALPWHDKVNLDNVQVLYSKGTKLKNINSVLGFAQVAQSKCTLNNSVKNYLDVLLTKNLNDYYPNSIDHPHLNDLMYVIHGAYGLQTLQTAYSSKALKSLKGA